MTDPVWRDENENSNTAYVRSEYKQLVRTQNRLTVAAMALQGILVSDNYTTKEAVDLAIKHADALLARLEETDDANP